MVCPVNAMSRGALPLTRRIRLFGVQIDAVRMDEAVARLTGWLDLPGKRCRFVVTPNADHSIMLQENIDLRAAYTDADLVLADGMPLVLASRFLKRPLPERVAGSDLVPALFDAACDERPLRTYLLGGAPGVAERAAEKIRARWPAVRIVGTDSPPFGFEHDAVEIEAILQRIARVRPDVLVVGLGAPKQELWVHRYRDRLAARIALCVGATIDFLAGSKPRAPLWMQRSGLEWLHRLMTEPRRLFRRYLRDAILFPQLVWREWRMGRAASQLVLPPTHTKAVKP
jgi:N-acetylglucosaminyldiphosphoundecaprenol N-acetyl-beta-D-mannosaminyltransferase